MRLRELRASDRPALEALIRGTDAFHEEEVAVALELIDAGADPASSYRFIVAENAAGEPTGYACFGLTPLSDGAYDLYWIVVDARLQRSGIGKALLSAAAAQARALGGRLLVIETSGKPTYADQRAFYARCGCTLLARYPDFYRLGDDKLVYLLQLTA